MKDEKIWKELRKEAQAYLREMERAPSDNVEARRVERLTWFLEQAYKKGRRSVIEDLDNMKYEIERQWATFRNKLKE